MTKTSNTLSAEQQLRQDVNKILSFYAVDYGIEPVGLEKLVALIEREKRAAVEEAFAHIEAWRVGGIGDLVVLERSQGHDDVVKQFPRILAELFPTPNGESRS